MTFRQLFLPLLVIAVFWVAGCERHPPAPTEPLTDFQKSMLQTYESIRVALASDDLQTVGRHARDWLRETEEASAVNEPVFFSSAQMIGRADSTEVARLGFKKMSLRARELVEGRPGWTVYRCTLADNAYWVQTGEDASNPYSGKRLSGTGEKVR